MNKVKPFKIYKPPYLPTVEDTKQDKDKSLKKWFLFPDSLPSSRFTGYQTRDNKTQNRGAFVIGQNVAMSLAQTPTVRAGVDLIGTDSGDSLQVNRAWVYETRDGVQIELKAFDTKIFYRIQGVMTSFQLLKGGFTANQNWGYGNISTELDATGATNFCNGVDNWFKYTGAFATFASNTVDTLTVQGSTSLINQYFRPEGTIIINGVEVTYTELNGNTFEGCSAIPASAVGDVLTQSPTPIDGSYLFQTWNPIFVEYASDDGMNVITFTGSAANFPAAGTIRYKGIDITYAAINGQTFTGCSAVPVAPTVGDILALKPGGTIGNLSGFKSSVIMANNGRLHARQETKKSVWNYSVLDNPYDFSTTGSLDTDAGAKEIEFGGSIVAYGSLLQHAVGFKPRLIKTLDFIQSGTRIDVPDWNVMVSTDDKGTTLGAMNQKSTFSTPLGLVFVTPDKRMVLLTSITANTQPQYLFLSDPIQQVFVNGVHDTGAGICLDNDIWYSFKQNAQSTFNDVVLHGNMLRQTPDNYGRSLPIQWDTPTIGWQVADWTIVFNQTTGLNELHWHSSINSNSYVVTPANKSDLDNSFTTIVRTWAEIFGYPQQQKKIDYCFVEIEMLENSVVQGTLLYDEDGVTGQYTYNLLGSSQNSFGTSFFNPFGASPFGYEEIGDSPGSTALTVYRFWLEIDPNISFFNLSFQLGGNTQNNDYNLVRLGYRLFQVYEDVARFYKTATN